MPHVPRAVRVRRSMLSKLIERNHPLTCNTARPVRSRGQICIPTGRSAGCGHGIGRKSRSNAGISPDVFNGREMSPRRISAQTPPAVDAGLRRLWASLGASIREARRERRWSVVDLAARAGISAGLVYRIEAGLPASSGAAVRLCVALGLRLEFAVADGRGGRSSEVLHVVRLRTETFRALCPESPAAFAGWWAGSPPTAGTSSAFILFDPLRAAASAPTSASRPRPWRARDSGATQMRSAASRRRDNISRSPDERRRPNRWTSGSPSSPRTTSSAPSR